MRILNKEEKDNDRIEFIVKHEWLKYYKELWTEGNGLIIEEGRGEENCTHTTQDFTTDQIEILELEEALKKMKNGKTRGIDGINTEMF